MNSKFRTYYVKGNRASRRKSLVLYKYLNPVRPEIKKWNPFVEDQIDDAYKSIDICNIVQPTNTGSSYGSWDLIKFRWPVPGTTEYTAIGKTIGLKWLLIRGWLNVTKNLNVKINWKLVLIKSQANWDSCHDFLLDTYYNYEYPPAWDQGGSTWQFPDLATRIAYGRHNFYKLVKNVTEHSEYKVSIKTIASGTVSPDGGFPAYRLINTVGSNPAVTVESNLANYELGWYPINVKITCNDNIDITTDRYYIMLLCDFPVGITAGSISSPAIAGPSTSASYTERQFNLNFFTVGYFKDS